MPDQPQLDALRERLDQEVVRCPNYETPEAWKCQSPAYAGGGLCPKCHGTGYVPNPAYGPLRELVREECGYSKSVEGIECVCIGGRVSMNGQVHSPCVRCKGTGYVTRSIEGWPKGALAGALFVATRDLIVFTAFRPTATLITILCSDDPDRAALAALLEALG